MGDDGYLGGHQADRRGKPGRRPRVPVKGTLPWTNAASRGSPSMVGVPFTGTLGREGLVQLDAYWRDKSAPTVVS